MTRISAPGIADQIDTTMAALTGFQFDFSNIIATIAFVIVLTLIYRTPFTGR